MLTNPVLASLLRSRSLQSNLFSSAPQSTVRLRPTQRISLQQRLLVSNSPKIKRTPLRPSWRIYSPHCFRNLRRASDKSTPSATRERVTEKAQGLSARFRELSRKYGWSAVGVYFGLSVLDFPFCFLAVQLVGPERIGEVEHAIVDGFWHLVAIAMPSMKPDGRVAVEEVEAEIREAGVPDGNGHKHKEAASTYMYFSRMLDVGADVINTGIWTQLLLAYGVHKSLIFFRIPLAAAVTPKVVKTLRGWGWNVGNRQPRTRSLR